MFCWIHTPENATKVMQKVFSGQVSQGEVNSLKVKQASLWQTSQSGQHASGEVHSSAWGNLMERSVIHVIDSKTHIYIFTFLHLWNPAASYNSSY
jgi:hypothetical protein